MKRFPPWLLLLLAFSGAAEQEELLQRIMAAVAEHRDVVLGYREEKVLSILQHSLISTGRLAYLPPDALIRKTDGDPPVHYLVSGSGIRVEEGGNLVREIRLDHQPHLNSLMSSLRAIISGDLGQLQDHYRTELNGDFTAWSLVLTPTGKELSRFLKWIRISGSRGQIDTVETLESGGDSSRMDLWQADE